MIKIKLFYSYSHKDEAHKDALETHLATLRSEGKIDEWNDRKITGGSDLGKEIESNMQNAQIILLLFSPDFIGSSSCKDEVKRALELKEKKEIEVVPIILRACSWQDTEVKNLLALPKDGKPMAQWKDKDAFWLDVYRQLKQVIEKVQQRIAPKIKDAFRKILLANPIANGTSLNELFVYPDIIKNSINLKLENNEVDSEKLKTLDAFGHQYILLEGGEQSGKTALCNMLFLHYLESGFYPILISGKKISGNGDSLSIANNEYIQQYDDPTRRYGDIGKEKRILFIDDINIHSMKKENFTKFVSSIKEHFNAAIIFIDELSNLSDKSLKNNYFSSFENFSIRHFGHKKRDALIKKCIAVNEKMDFDIENPEQLARLDRDTQHVNTIIGTNIVPSYPVFIVTIFHIVESVTSQNLSQTSYGHCYQTMITMHLGKIGVKAADLDSYFNFLTELAYSMFTKNSKTISTGELGEFLIEYRKKFIVQETVDEELIRANIIKEENGSYSFQYIYIYYYFVAKYIARKIDDEHVKQKFSELVPNIHLKDNANIVIFVAHHTKDIDFLNEIILSAMSTFEKFSEATLSGKEKNFIKGLSDNLRNIQLPSDRHSVQTERNRTLQRKDALEQDEEEIENEVLEQNDDPLLIDIRKSAKSIEIIGQILKNQYGSLERDKLRQSFEEGQNVGLRLLKSFMEMLESNRDEFEYLIQSVVGQIAKEKNKKLTKDERDEITQKCVAWFSYSVIHGWLRKIADSLGYDKLIDIADDVNSQKNTVASKLINLSIHIWHTKQLNIEKIKSIHRELTKDNNHQAIYILTSIVSRHVYMHPVGYKDKQRLNAIFDFSIKKQLAAQQKLGNK